MSSQKIDISLHDSYLACLHKIIVEMDQHLNRLSSLTERLDRVIQPYKWSNTSAQEIQHLFVEMNNVIDDAQHWIATKSVLVNGNKECQPTKVKFKVPADGPNKRVNEATVCFYLDKLTQAVEDDDKEDYESAIFSLIDVGRAYDRVMDNSYDSEDLHDDNDTYGDIYTDDFDGVRVSLDRKNHNPTTPVIN